MAKRRIITLGQMDACILVRGDGSTELHLPNFEDDDNANEATILIGAIAHKLSDPGFVSQITAEFEADIEEHRLMS